MGTLDCLGSPLGRYELPEGTEGIIVLNIASYAGGTDLWGGEWDDDETSVPCMRVLTTAPLPSRSQVSGMTTRKSTRRRPPPQPPRAAVPRRPRPGCPPAPPLRTSWLPRGAMEGSARQGETAPSVRVSAWGGRGVTCRRAPCLARAPWTLRTEGSLWTLLTSPTSTPRRQSRRRRRRRRRMLMTLLDGMCAAAP
jgi:hypothetical protein